MNKAEEILNKNIETMSLEKDMPLLWYNIKRSLYEYGKYCAEIAFDDGFNLGFIDCQRPSFEQWWSEFQKKEGTR